MTISLETGPGGAPETTLEGELRDQAAVLGVLHTFYEQHLELLPVSRVTGDRDIRNSTFTNSESE